MLRHAQFYMKGGKPTFAADARFLAPTTKAAVPGQPKHQAHIIDKEGGKRTVPARLNKSHVGKSRT
jgi:hypothetical protein